MPLQHQVAFIEAIKVLDMTMMAQVFTKEQQDFEQKLSTVLNCMEVVARREACLGEIVSMGSRVDSVGDEELNQTLDSIESKLRDLRHLSIRAVELVVLWRDQFRYLALIGSKQRTIRKRRA